VAQADLGSSVKRRESMSGQALRTFGMATALVLVLAACGNTTVSDPPSSTVIADATATPRPTPTPIPKPNASATAKPKPTPTPTPTPSTAPAFALAHCTGKSSGTIAGSHAAASKNWAGFVTIAGHSTVSCVESSWIQPKVTCASKSRSDVSIWVGIGGASSADKVLIQTGTDVACRGGKPSYNAWTEVFPRESEQIIPSFVVNPGDQIWARVSVSGKTFSMTVANITRKETHTVKTTVKTAHRLTADWVVEAPSAGCPGHCTTLPLAHFASTRFSGGFATIGGVLAGIDHWNRDIVTMYVGDATTHRAVVSGVRDGGTFTVAWRHR
jgi:Peptidase A4 family